MTRRLYVFALVAALLLTAVPNGATAGPLTEQLQAAVGRVFKALEAPDRRAAVTRISRDLFDWTEMARRSLGRHWEALTDPEREEFTALLGRLVDARLVMLAGYTGAGIEYVDESVDGDQAVVRTKIATTQGRGMILDYLMARRDGRWLIYDVVADGSSMVGNYRAQFTHIMKTASYSRLVEKLTTQ